VTHDNGAYVKVDPLTEEAGDAWVEGELRQCEDGTWERAVPIGPSHLRHWPWFQRIIDWLWRVNAR